MDTEHQRDERLLEDLIKRMLELGPAASILYSQLPTELAC